MKTVSRTSIHQNLKSLDVLYKRAATHKSALFYSKLAILELCGWVEETMDRVVRSCACRTLREPTNRGAIEENVILRTHGFDYNNHFRRMLTQVIVLHGVEQVERRMDSMKLQVLKSTLGGLRSRRDKEAHTHLVGTMRTLDAPSATIQNFERVYDGLKEVSAQLKTKGW